MEVACQSRDAHLTSLWLRAGCAAVGVAGGVLLLRADKQAKALNAALQAAELQVCHTLGTWRQALNAAGSHIVFCSTKKTFFQS